MLLASASRLRLVVCLPFARYRGGRLWPIPVSFPTGADSLSCQRKPAKIDAPEIATSSCISVTRERVGKSLRSDSSPPFSWPLAEIQGAISAGKSKANPSGHQPKRQGQPHDELAFFSVAPNMAPEPKIHSTYTATKATPNSRRFGRPCH